MPKSRPFGPDNAKNRTHDLAHDLSGPNVAGKAVFLLSWIIETSDMIISRKMYAKENLNNVRFVVNKFGQNQISRC